MRADIGADIALDTVLRNPVGHAHRHIPLFISRRTGRHGPARIIHKSGNGKLIAFKGIDGALDAVDIIRYVLASARYVLPEQILALAVLPVRRRLHPPRPFHSGVDCRAVFGHDVVSFFPVSLFHRIL